MGKIEVLLDPEERETYIEKLLRMDGLSDIQEDPQAAYCPISLTSTPEELKPTLKSRQQKLMSVLGEAGISAYDPASAPYSPDIDLSAPPGEIYRVDSGRVVSARFFSGHNILPSTGFGSETEKARIYNRISVILMDKSIRVSRMQPNRFIYLQYENFDEQSSDFISVFEMLQEYEPGMGLNNGLPVLLGFKKTGRGYVDLEDEVYNEFPELQYHYDEDLPIVKLKAENPGLFYELE